MRATSLALAATFVLFGCEQPPSSIPASVDYSVMDVAPTDTLALRSSPDASASIVENIPHDGQAVVPTGRSTTGGWSEVSYQGKRGWVNARFLGLGQPGAQLPALLECMGTEPFWRIILSPGNARAELLFSERTYNFKLTGAAVAMGRSDIWLAKGTSEKADMKLIARRESCSDGMSDTNYPYSSVASVPGAELIAGCCRPHQPRQVSMPN